MTLEEQYFIILMTLISSFTIGVFFDGYRILCEKLNIKKWAILICDICFGVFSAIFVFQIFLWSNNGQLRLIILVAFFIGLLLYYLILSREVIAFWLIVYKVIYNIIKILLNLINTLLIKPLKLILGIILLGLSKLLIIIKPILLVMKWIKEEGLLALLKKLLKKNNR
ncbi:MAG: spore cortex biosynthesis protein YabQ [Vulcanibacillus sp.]